MIISIRGASGSGKTSMVRKLVKSWGAGVPHFQEGRRKPLYYTYGGGLVILGHYEITNGGIDTLGTLDEAYGLAARFDDEGKTVVMEGKCMSDGVRHVTTLAEEGRDVRVIFLNTSLEDCVDSVRRRGHNIARASMERTHRKIARDYDGMCRVLALKLFYGTRDEGLAKLLEWTGCRNLLSLE